MPALSRTQKARLLRVFNVPRLMWATLVAAGLGVAWVAMAVVLGLAGLHLPHALAMPAFMALPTLANLLRLRAVARGWGAVSVPEIPHLGECLERPAALDHDPLAGELALPLKVQADLARQIRRQGWLAWSDVDAALKTHGCPPRCPLFGGGAGTERVARRADLNRFLALPARLGAVTPPAHPRPRQRL